MPRSVALPIAIVLALAPAAAAQGGWTRQSPLPTGSDLFDVQMLSATEAWAAVVPGQVLHTTDQGRTWETTTLATDSLHAIFFLDAQRGWAAGNGFFHTIDGGATWVQDNNWGSIYDLYFLDAQRGWACGNGGVTYRTTNGGLSWTWATVGPITTLRSIHFLDAQRGWTVNIDGEIFKSNDGGATWTLALGSGGSNLNTVQFVSATEGWATGGDTFLHTVDGGATWTQVAVPPNTWSFSAHFPDRLHGVAAGEYGNVVRTTNAGQTWTTVSPIGSGSRLWSVHFADATTGMFVGETGELSLSTDGGQSRASLQSGSGYTVHGIAAVDPLHAWAATDGGEVLWTEDGRVWNRSIVDGFDRYGRILGVDFLDASTGWAAGQHSTFGNDYGRIARSGDGGRSWQLQHTVTAAEFTDVAALGPQDVIACGYRYGQGGMVLRSSDGGASWTDVAPSLASFEDLHFVDAQTGWLSGGSLVYRTTDGGWTWTQQANLQSYVEGLSFADASNGWAVGWDGRVARTANGGQTWTLQDTGAGGSTHFFGVHAVDASTAWVTGTNGFAARTTDGGASWQRFDVAGTWTLEGAFFHTAGDGWVAGYGIWFRGQPPPPCSPIAYCTAKTNSQGGRAALGWTGSPSVSGGGFAVTVSGGLPLKSGFLFFGRSGRANLPFYGGTLCAQPQLTRMAAHQLDAAGSTSYTIPLSAPMAGTTRWYQFWHRDPQHPDGTGVAISDALETLFCD